MSTTPGITLNFKLENIAGANNSGKITATLVNFGTTPPLVSGTALIADVVVTAQAAADGTGSLTLWGNYQLVPTSTFYDIQITAADGSSGPVAAYQFSTSGTFDLSTINPLDSTPGFNRQSFSTSKATHQWIDSYNATTGLFTQSQPSLADIASGTSASALVIGSSGTLSASGTGVINATEINGVPIIGTPDLGKIPIGQGDGTAVFADPLVQGLQTDGSAVGSLNPVLIGFKGADGNLHNASSDNSGRLNVNVNGSVAVTGTFFQTTQPVSGTITANAGTGTFSTQDSATSATAAAVPAKAIYVAGNKSGSLVGLSLDSSGNLNVNLAAGSISGGNAAASTTGSAVPSSADYLGVKDGSGNLVGLLAESVTNPNLRVSLYNGASEVSVVSNALKVDGSAVTQPVSGTFWQATQPISASSLPLPTGAATSAKQPALGTAGTASNDVITVQGIASMTAIKVDGSAVTQPVSLSTLPALTAGTALIGKVGIDQTTPGTTNLVAVSNSFALDATLTGGTQKTLIFDGTNTIGTAAHPVQVSLANTATNSTAVKVDGSGVTQPISVAATLGVKELPQTSGGLGLPFSASVTNTKTAVKASAGQVYAIWALNNAAAITYVQVFDKTTANVTVGTTAPDYVLPLPANFGGILQLPSGCAHANAITIACTTTRTGSTTATADLTIWFA